MKFSGFIRAANFDDLETFVELLNDGMDINICTKHGSTALQIAANHDSFKIAEFLVRKGANLNLQNNNGWSPLHTAANHSARITKLLLDNGADSNLLNNDGNRPSAYAYPEGFRYAIENYPNTTLKQWEQIFQDKKKEEEEEKKGKN